MNNETAKKAFGLMKRVEALMNVPEYGYAEINGVKGVSLSDLLSVHAILDNLLLAGYNTLGVYGNERKIIEAEGIDIDELTFTGGLSW